MKNKHICVHAREFVFSDYCVYYRSLIFGYLELCYQLATDHQIFTWVLNQETREIIFNIIYGGTIHLSNKLYQPK